MILLLEILGLRKGIKTVNGGKTKVG